MSNVIGEAVIIVGADGRLFVKQLEDQVTPPAQKTGLNVAGMIGKGLAVGAVAAGAGMAGILGTALAKGFERLKSIDDAKGALVGLGYTAKEITGVMGNALDAVKGTAFGLGEAAAQAANLAAAGVEPGKELTRSLKLIADTATIAGTSLGDIGSIFNKVAAGGTVTTEVLQQLQDRGVPALQFLADSLGMTTAETQKLVSKGKINFEQFQVAMTKGLGGAALASGNTFSGAMSNVGAALGRLGASLLGGVFERLPKLMGDSITVLDNLGPAAKQVGAAIGESFGKAYESVQKFAAGLSGKGPIEGFSGTLNTLGLGVRALVLAFQEGDVTSDGFVGAMERTGVALSIMWDSGMKVLSYMREHRTISEALAISMGALLVVTQAHATFLAIQAAGGLVAYITQINIIQTATKIWAAVQWVLNSALLASPVTWVIAGLIALGAAIVYLWKNNETFRTIVLTVWDAIKTAIAAVSDWITGTVVPALTGAWDAVASASQSLWSRVTGAWDAVAAAATSLWQRVVEAWDAVSAAGQQLWANTTVVWDGIMGVLTAVGGWINDVFGPWFQTLAAIVEFAFKAMEILILAFWVVAVKPAFEGVTILINALGAVFMWLYNNAVKPAFDFIMAAIRLWWEFVQLEFLLAQTAIQFLGSVFLWLYNSAVKPAFDFIVAVAKAWWTDVNAIFNLLIAGIKLVGGWFVDLYEKYVKPQIDLMGTLIRAVWVTYISPAFDAISKGVGLLGGAFDKAVSAVKIAWDRMQDVVKAPIKFVIQTVLNGGLVKGFNWLSEKVGGPHIDDIPLPFALGGVTPGYSPGRDIHKFWSPTGGSLALSGGEAIMRPEFTRSMGGKKGIDRLNRLAMQGKLTGDFAGGGVVHGFAGGGVIDWITSQASSAFSWVGDTASAIWQALNDPVTYLKSLMPAVPAAGVVSQYADAAGTKLLTSVVAKVKALFTDFQAAYATTGGPVFAKMKEWVMAHLGLPYVYGANGPNSFDCSSFTQQASAAGGVSIPRTSETQQAFARAVAAGALKPGDLGFFGNPAYHVMLNMGGGQWASAPHTGAVTQVSGASPESFGATFARGGVFRPLLMDQGGVLPKGLSMVNNQTGGPEALYPGGNLNVTVELSIDDLAKLHTLDDFLKMLESARTTARKTQRSGKVNA